MKTLSFSSNKKKIINYELKATTQQKQFCSRVDLLVDFGLPDWGLHLNTRCLGIVLWQLELKETASLQKFVVLK